MIHQNRTHVAAPKRRLTAAAKVILATGAIALGTMSVTPAMAYAEGNNNPKRTEAAIKQDCKDAGGDYWKGPDSAGNTSHCAYFDTDGNQWVDNYKNGVFTGTSGPYKPKPTNTLPSAGSVILDPSRNQL